MEVSIRECFWQGESTWGSYASSFGLSPLTKVRTGDAGLNLRIGNPVLLYPPDDDVLSALCSLPSIDSTGQCFYLLAVNLEEEAVPPLPDKAILLGCDICDDTRTSSILNCRVWAGKLAPIVPRINLFGLLALSDAKLAQELLPEEWGEDEPHACVDIWALYDITGMRPDCSLE